MLLWLGRYAHLVFTSFCHHCVYLCVCLRERESLIKKISTTIIFNVILNGLNNIICFTGLFVLHFFFRYIFYYTHYISSTKDMNSLRAKFYATRKSNKCRNVQNNKISLIDGLSLLKTRNTF